MKKKILICILMTIVLFMECGFMFLEEDKTADTEFTVESLEKFTDKNLSEYTLEELDSLIKEYQKVQATTLTLINAAETLGWPEDSDAIVCAKAEWSNAQKAITVYKAQYDKIQAEIEAKWEKRKAKYPRATEAWLYMKELGWSDYVCAGIMGNLMTEVGGQTLNLNYEKYTKPNYYGICQWNKTYKDCVWGKDFEGQLDFLRDSIEYEIDTYGIAYQKGFNFNSFLASPSEEQAALAFAKTYERCSSKSYKIRQINAAKAYDYFVD